MQASKLLALATLALLSAPASAMSIPNSPYSNPAAGSQQQQQLNDALRMMQEMANRAQRMQQPQSQQQQMNDVTRMMQNMTNMNQNMQQQGMDAMIDVYKQQVEMLRGLAATPGMEESMKPQLQQAEEMLRMYEEMAKTNQTAQPASDAASGAQNGSDAYNAYTAATLQMLQQSLNAARQQKLLLETNPIPGMQQQNLDERIDSLEKEIEKIQNAMRLNEAINQATYGDNPPKSGVIQPGETVPMTNAEELARIYEEAAKTDSATTEMKQGYDISAKMLRYQEKRSKFDTEYTRISNMYLENAFRILGEEQEETERPKPEDFENLRKLAAEAAAADKEMHEAAMPGGAKAMEEKDYLQGYEEMISRLEEKFNSLEKGDNEMPSAMSGMIPEGMPQNMEDLKRLLEEAQKVDPETLKKMEAEKQAAAEQEAKTKAELEAFRKNAKDHSFSPEDIEKYVENGGDINEPLYLFPKTRPLICDVSDPDTMYNYRQHGQKAYLDALIKCGADINAKDEEGRNALISAIPVRGAGATSLMMGSGEDYKKLLAIISTLIENGININDKDNTGNSALMYAVQSRRGDEIVKMLVENGADVNAADQKGVSALCYALQLQTLEMRPETVALLINKGANVNAVDANGTPALILAARRNDSQTVRLLVEKGADANAVDKDGKSVLSYMTPDEKTLALLIGKNADVSAGNKDSASALVLAAKNGNDGTVKLLIENGADINAVDKDGASALTYYLQRNTDGLIDFLVEKGADVNVVGKDGIHPLIYALQKHKEEITRLLVENGANVDAVDQKGTPALSYAIQQFKEDIAKFLIEHDADVNAADKDGVQPLIYALQKHYDEVIRLLVENGADVNAANKEGTPALILAIQNGKDDIIKLLVENGADVNAVNEKGMSTLMLATERGCKKDTLECIIDHGADLTMKDNEGKTIADYAGSNYLAGVKELLEKKYAAALKAGKPLNEATQELVALIVDGGLTPELLKEKIKEGADVNAKIKIDGVATYPVIVFSDFRNIGDFEIVSGDEQDFASPAFNGKRLAATGADQKAANRFAVFWELLKAGADTSVCSPEGLSVFNLISVTFRPSGSLDDDGKDYKDAENLEKWTLLLNLLKQEGVKFGAAGQNEIGAFIFGANVARRQKSRPYTLSPKVQLAVVRFLKENGVDINASLKDRLPVLMIAVSLNPNMELLQGLVDLGADLLAKDHEGKALPDYIPDYPEGSGYYKACEWLRKQYNDKAD